MLLDLLFFFAYGILGYFAAGYVFRILEQLSQHLSANPGIVATLASDAVYRQQLAAIITAILIMLAIAWLLYSILHGINWFIVAGKLLNYKVKFWTFLGRFAVTSLVWFSSIAVLTVIYLLVSFKSLFRAQAAAWIIFLILFFIVLYFGFMTHALTPGNRLRDIYKKTFRIGIRKAHYALLMYAVLVVIGIIIDFILRLSGKLSMSILYAAGIILFLPFMTFARIYLIQTVNKLDESRKNKTGNKIKNKANKRTKRQKKTKSRTKNKK